MTGSGGCGEFSHALGVYLVGAISPADRSAFGDHLARCADCRDELARLAGLPGLLGNVPAADVTRMAPQDADPAGRSELAASGPATPAPRPTTVRGSNPRTGAGAIVTYVRRPSGLELDVQVSGIAAGTACELHVLSHRGQDVAAVAWTVSPEHPGAWHPARSPFPASGIRGFAVTAGGKMLVSVPAE